MSLLTSLLPGPLLVACAVLYAAIAVVAWWFVGASALAEGHVRPDAPYVDAVTEERDAVPAD